ncbi:MAG: tetratricopeptide repeat protein [Bacteroidota bacterium]
MMPLLVARFHVIIISTLLLVAVSVPGVYGQDSKVDSLQQAVAQASDTETKAQHEIDSLNQRLSTEISDQQRVDIYNRLARIQYTDSFVVATTSKKALQLAQKINYPEGLSDAYYNLGLSAKEKYDYQQATAWYTKALHTAQQVSYRNGQAKACFGLGQTYREQGQFSKAHEYHTRALEIYTELGNKLREAVTIMFIGITYERQGDYPEALKHYHEALARFSKLSVEPYYFADLHADLGSAYSKQARYSEAVDHYLSALAIYEQLGEKDGKAYMYNDIGVAFYEQKNYDQALNYYQESLKLYLALGDKRWIAQAYNNIALLHEHQNRLDSALFYYQQGLTLAQESQNNYMLGWIFNGLAIVYQKKQEYQQALEYVQQAIALREEAAGDQELLAQSYNTLGKNYLALGQYQDALAMYQKSQGICEKIGNPLNLKDALEGISLSYEGLHQIAQAYPYLKRFKAVADSLSSEENQKALIAKTMQFEFDQQQALAQAEAEKQELVYQQEIKEQRQYIYAAIAGFFASLVIVLIILKGRQKQKQTNRLLAQQNEDIHRQKEQLQEMDTIKSRFFTNISHEFRTPLTVIGGMAQQIKKFPNEWLDKGLKVIERNNANLLNLVNQILDLRKLETGALSLHLIQGDIIHYLQFLVDSFHSLAESNVIQIHFLSKPKEVIMDYDQEKMLRILSNLLSNAIKFTPEGGHVYITTDTTSFSGDSPPANLTPAGTSEWLEIVVKDTGMGIPEDKLPHIFDRFYQVDDSSTRPGEGTGIGLSLTYELIKLLQGSITVESVMNQGTTFRVLLPMSRQAAPSDELPDLVGEEKVMTEAHLADTRQYSEDPAATISAQEQLPTLLIIEDNQDLRTYMESLLAAHYRILMAKDGAEGIEMALEHIPDLILSDVMMPNKDGFAVCATLKQDERTSHIPIVLLTAKADVDSRIAGLKRGADAYLAKPFHQEELFARLEQLHQLRRQLQARYASLEVQPLGSTDEAEVHFEDAFMAKLRREIEENLDNSDFGITALCTAMGMSRSQLHLKIKALTDRSTSHFIRGIRLQRAKALLEQSDLNISEVAYEVGFQDPAYFSRTFTQEFGVSPTSFLKAKV